MSGWLLDVAAGVVVLALLYGAFVAGLALAGRGSSARAIARFVPDCVVLFERLLRDPQVPRSSKLLLGGVVVYLLTPIDLVPDFIPVAGQLDDALIVGLALRRVLRSVDESLVASHWPGPPSSLDLVLRFAGRRPAVAVGR